MGQLSSFGLSTLDDAGLQGPVYFEGDDGSVIIRVFEDNDHLTTKSRLSSSTGILCFLFPECSRPIFRRGRDYRPSFLPHGDLLCLIV